jgi:hypothetical protein
MINKTRTTKAKGDYKQGSHKERKEETGTTKEKARISKETKITVEQQEEGTERGLRGSTRLDKDDKQETYRATTSSSKTTRAETNKKIIIWIRRRRTRSQQGSNKLDDEHDEEQLFNDHNEL